MIPESEIINGCREGKRYYQEILYKKYSRKMFAVCLRFFRSREEAEDCLQDGFIKVFRNINSFSGLGSFEGWIRKIIINTAINKYRENQKTIKEEDFEDELQSAIEGIDFNVDYLTEDYLMKLIQNLPENYRVVFNMYAIEGYSHKEISKMLNIAEGTSKSLLSRARVILQNKVGKFFYEINEKIEIRKQGDGELIIEN